MLNELIILLAEAVVVDPNAVAESEAGWLLMVAVADSDCNIREEI